MWAIVLAAAATLIVTILAGLALDFFRNRSPKIIYTTRDAVPIKVGGINVGAYVLYVLNYSNRVIKDVTCYVDAPPAKLRNGGISVPHGVQYSISEKDSVLEVSVPYLRGGEDVLITIIAESIEYIPRSPSVAVRSPNNVRVFDRKNGNVGVKGIFPVAALTAGSLGVLASIMMTFVFNIPNRQDNLTFAAAIAGLPELAKLYAVNNGNLYYYNQGDLAYALAADTKEKENIVKYRKFIETIIKMKPRILSESRANLLYSLGKINIIIGDKDMAIKDFRDAISENKSVVNKKLSVDPATQEFLKNADLH